VNGVQHAEQYWLDTVAAAGVKLPLVLELDPDHYALQFIFGCDPQSNSIVITYQKVRENSILRSIFVLFAFAYALTAGTLNAQTPSLSLYAAGSLQLAFDDIIALHAARTGTRFVPTYGPSGKLREEIEKGSVYDSSALGDCA
jgi:extracellular solute-binding protein